MGLFGIGGDCEAATTPDGEVTARALSIIIIYKLRRGLAGPRAAAVLHRGGHRTTERRRGPPWARNLRWLLIGGY